VRRVSLEGVFAKVLTRSARAQPKDARLQRGEQLVSPSCCLACCSPALRQVVTGNLPSLPGCNPLTTTRDAALAVSCPDMTNPERFTPTVYTGNIPPPGAQVVAGSVFPSPLHSACHDG